MKAILSVAIEQRLPHQILQRGVATIETDLPVSPQAGWGVSHAAWKRERSIKHVSLDLVSPEPCLLVHLGDERADSEDHYVQIVETYREHGWEVRD